MRFESIEALFPEATVLVKPVGGVFQGGGLQLARAPLRLAAARDQAGALQHLQMLGNRRQAHVERLGQLGDGRLTAHQAGEDGAPRRIGEGGESRAEVVGRHGCAKRSDQLTIKLDTSLDTARVKAVARQVGRCVVSFQSRGDGLMACYVTRLTGRLAGP